MALFECASIFDLIQNLKPDLIHRLYGGDGVVPTNQSNDTEFSNQVTWACKSIFQSLPVISKHVRSLLLLLILLKYSFIYIYRLQ